MKVKHTSPRDSWADAKKRNRSGNVMILVAAITVGIIIAVILFALDYNQFLGASHQHLTAVESAGLAAVQDLSRIVIRDENYGFIALTDYPPIGKKTLAGDGRPLPVTSVNTIVGTARLDLIIAHQINSPTMVKLAETDADNANAAARLLTECLKSALAQSESGPTGTAEIAGNAKGSDPKLGPWTDMDGVVINPFANAKRVYMSNLTTMSNGGKPIVNSFKCNLGYVESGGSTLTRIPNPENLAQVTSNQKSGNFYKAFINIPAHGKDFYFAGVSAQPALIDARQFRPDDTKRICSAVRVEAEHSFERAESTTQQSFKTIACAEPSGSPDTAAAGVMTIAFPDGVVPGINTVRDLLTNGDLSSKTGTVTEAKDGDWPLDGAASLIGGVPLLTPGGEDSSPTAADMFGGGFFDWLRSAHARPNIAQVSGLMSVNLHDALDDGAVAVSHRFDLMPPAIAGNKKKSSDLIRSGIMNITDTDRLGALIGRQPAGLQAYDAITTLAPVTTLLPANATEVTVDQSGTLRSTSGAEVGGEFMGDYWTAVQNTQSAAFQTLAAAELGLKGAPGNIMLLNAKANAEAAVKTTADLVKHQRTYTADGLSKNSDGSFQVGGAKFTPHPTPAANIAALLADAAPSGAPSNTSWSALPANFTTFKPSQSKASTDTDDSSISAKLLMVEIDAEGNIVTTALQASPFSGLPIADGQQLGIVYNAIKTVGNLTWSAVSRSQCHHPGQGKHGGQPLTGTPVDWCERATYKFDTGSAQTKGKGQNALGLVVIAPGAPTGVKGQGGSNKGGAGSGSGTKTQVPLDNNGKGPRSARAGTGHLKQDKAGYPWGFKGPNNLNGAKWSVSDVKYQFPGGEKEIGKSNDNDGEGNDNDGEGNDNDGEGNDNGWGGCKNRLNSGQTISKLGPGVSYPATTPLSPYGEQATFAPKGGGTLPQQPRASYYCGGMAFEFQLRGPVVTVNPGEGTNNGLKLVPGSGMAEVGGLPIRVPGLGLNIDIVSGSANSGVLGLNENAFTKTIPNEPNGI